MTDPERWADGAADAPDEIRSLLVAARREGPTLAQKAGLAAKLGFPGAGLWSILGSKAGIAGATVLAATVGVTAAQYSQDEPVPSSQAPSNQQASSSRAPSNQQASSSGQQADASENVENAAVPETMEAAEADPVEPAAPSSDRDEKATEPRRLVQPTRPASADREPSHDPKPAARPSPSSAPSEASLIRSARNRVSTAPGQALSTLKRHRHLYPNGVLSQEREVLTIQALRNAGNTTAADRRAASFKQAHPDSAHDLGE